MTVQAALAAASVVAAALLLAQLSRWLHRRWRDDLGRRFARAVMRAACMLVCTAPLVLLGFDPLLRTVASAR